MEEQLEAGAPLRQRGETKPISFWHRTVLTFYRVVLMRNNSSSKIIPLKPRRQRMPEPRASQEEPEVVEYEETISAPSWLRIAVFLGFLGIIGFFLVYPFVSEGSNDLSHLFLALMFALVLWLAEIFLSMKICVTNKGLQFGFYLFSKKLSYDEIVECSVMRYRLADFLGWGLRKSAAGCTLYNVPGDQRIAVRVVVADNSGGKKEFAFSAKRPQVICKKIQSHLSEPRS